MKYAQTEPRTMQQNARLHVLCGKLRIDAEQRHELMREFSNGRTSSSKELYAPECNQLIHRLEQQLTEREDNRLYKVRRKLFSLAHELGWEDATGKVDRARLDGFLLKFGPGKKILMAMDAKELSKAITQLEQVNAKQAANG